MWRDFLHPYTTVPGHQPNKSNFRAFQNWLGEHSVASVPGYMHYPYIA